MNAPSLQTRLLADKRPEPSYPALPQVSDRGESSVAGIYLAGEVAGTPLVKLGLNRGTELADAIRAELGPPDADPDLLDVLIVGAGPAGLGAAMRAHELGMRYRVIESGRVAQTVENMYSGKLLFAEPEAVDNASSLWFEECTREQLLERWHAQIEEAGLAIQTFEKVTDVQRTGAHFEVTTDKAGYRARRVLLALGKAGNPRRAGVPGEAEHPGKLYHHLSDPKAVEGKRVLVYGGGDVAAEAALALAERNEVTMVTIDRELTYPKKRNRDALEGLAADGKLGLHLDTALEGFDADTATIRGTGEEPRTLPNDLVFEMIGAEIPKPFFDRLGIAMEGAWTPGRYTYLTIVSLLVYTLYALKKFPEAPYSWPFYLFIDRQGFADGTRAVFDVGFSPFAWVFEPAALEQIRGTLWFQQGYLYSLAYTIVMGVFGYRAMHRWGAIASDGRYQRYRYASLIFFQVAFFLIANVIAVQGLSMQFAWRAWGLYQPWPLFFNTFHWFSDSDPKVVVLSFAGAGLFGTLVAIPWAAHRHGKRFCTWICGCGGLAETLGDRWRHLSAKGDRSRAWEFQGVVVLVAAFFATLVTVGMYETRADNAWAQTYSYVVDFWLVAVIPIALYPFFGGKVWCRYWCPLAAYNGLLARLYGKLEIRSDDKCISCTQCSRHCQVGVDVMAFAKNAEPFDNANSNCIQCGICIDVCPMDVLSFGQSDEPRRLNVIQ